MNGYRRYRCSLPRPEHRAMAVVAAVLSALVVSPALLAAEPQLAGRLFLTPEQRHDLDQRRGRSPEEADSANRMATNAPVVLNGVLRSEHGQSLVWINGVPRAVAARAVGPDATHRIATAARGGSTSARLKPGQSWDPATGVIRDCVQCVTPAPVDVAAAGDGTPDAQAGAAPAAAAEFR